MEPLNLRIPNRLPCSVCGADALHHNGWFLLVENRWFDQLKILTWHPSLAAHKDVKSACCRRHLRVLVARWMNQASLCLDAGDDPPMPITSNPTRGDLDLTSESVGQLIGELSVCREAFSRGWTGSQTALKCVLDAMVPAEPEPQTYTMELDPLSTLYDQRSHLQEDLPTLREPLQGFALHQGSGAPAL